MGVARIRRGGIGKGLKGCPYVACTLIERAQVAVCVRVAWVEVECAAQQAVCGLSIAALRGQRGGIEGRVLMVRVQA